MEAAMSEGDNEKASEALAPDEATLASFLSMLADAGQIHLVTIDSQDRHPITGRDFGCDVPAALHFALKHNRDGGNIYWTVNLVRQGVHKKPTKADIVAGRFCHVDIDPPKDSGTLDKARYIEALETLDFPSFIIDSGGGLQAFWRVEPPDSDLNEIETMNIILRNLYSGDNCQNIDRIMRVPGTVNWLDARKRARGRVPVLSTIVKGWDHADV
jgi:hypothetical protein